MLIIINIIIKSNIQISAFQLYAHWVYLQQLNGVTVHRATLKPSHRVTIPLIRSVIRFLKTVSNSIKDSQSHLFSAWQPGFSVSFIF